MRIGVARRAVKPRSRVCGPFEGSGVTSRPSRGSRDGRVRSASLSPVGSKGSKPRKPQHSQHLPKAGTKADNERLMHEEHEAILDTMGLGGVSAGTKRVVWIVGAVMLIGAVLAFIVITVALS